MILVPNDFTYLSQLFKEQIQSQIESKNIGLLVYPQTTLTLDKDAVQRLSRSRMFRQ
jgi:hypothetical protein